MNKILESLEFREEKAELLFGWNRYILIRGETLAQFQKRVEERIGQGTSELMVEAAYEIGTRIGEGYLQESQLSRRGMIASMLESACELGWAKLYLKETEGFPGLVELETHHSAFAAAYGKSDHPVCHFITGIFSGAFSRMIGPDMESSEVQCMAMGHPACIFRFQLAGTTGAQAQGPRAGADPASSPAAGP